MSSTPAKRERREAARQARLEREAAEAAAARRKRRMYQLLAALGAAAVLVVVAILVSSGGGNDNNNAADASGLKGRQETTAMLEGIPQKENVLGNPNAPVTVYEFADLQCPFCAEFSRDNLPLLIRDFVRPGKVKLVYQDMAFLGNDSETAAAAAAAAGQQDRLWYFTNLFYWNQGQENTGYVTDQFLTNIYKGIPGLDVAKANADRQKAPATDAIKEPRTLAQQYGVSSTPTFVAGPSGGELQRLDASGSDYQGLKSALDQVVQQASKGT
jgi:protein-disulfide isomerase